MGSLCAGSPAVATDQLITRGKWGITGIPNQPQCSVLEMRNGSCVQSIHQSMCFVSARRLDETAFRIAVPTAAFRVLNLAVVVHFDSASEDG
jgi:hypothetical protein